MSGDAHVRTAAAVRTAVLWMSICMLLQHLGQHPQFTVEAEGSVVVPILRYFTLPNSIFSSNYGGRVDFTNSVGACRENGGSLVSGQSAAAQDVITTQLREALPVGQTLAHTYMGGDAMYSINWETDPTKQCTRGPGGASLKCIYQWNMGLFTSESTDGQGVSFYRGSLYSVPGAGPMNGYSPFWPANYPAHGQPFVISRYVKGSGAVSSWYDGFGTPVTNAGETPENTFMMVCEVQDGYTVPTTTLPPTPAPASWIQKHWYVPLIIILAALAAAALLIILLCCLVGRDEDKYLFPMIIRDRSDVPLRARDISDDDDDNNDYDDRDGHFDTGFGNRDLSMPEPAPMPMENIDAANVSVYSVAENNIYDDGDVFADRNQ